jgi:AraC-like DNA-binding protein
MVHFRFHTIIIYYKALGVNRGFCDIYWILVMTEKKPWQGWWRPSKSPSVPVPLGARSVGRADVQPGWEHGTGQIHWINFYWGVSGEVGFLADDKRCVIPGGFLVLHPPETRIKGYPTEKDGRYRWMTLDGPLAMDIVKTFGFSFFQLRPAGRCPEELFDQLETEIQDVTTAGEYRAGMTAYEILTRAAWGGLPEPAKGRAEKIVARCLRLIQDRYVESDFTVDRLARELNLHRSSLTRLFHRRVGLSLSDYIRRLRIRRALSLLKDSEKTVREIAFACGFSDPAYFSRCISAELGANPKKLRERL